MPPKKNAAAAGTKAEPKAGGGGAVKKNSKVYNRPDPIQNGEVLTDMCGKSWRIGKSVGVGGFGEIYLASEETGKSVTDKANYVVKIEPHANGPLFVEISVYIRIAKLEMIEEWKRAKSNDNLGMPWYVTSGVHDYKSDKYRFMVIPRFGHDLHKLLIDKPGKRFHIKTVQAVALQVIDTLEYIHSKDYIHGDIKASNLLLGRNLNTSSSTSPASKKNQQQQPQQVYLLDFGLACKYVNSEKVHVPYAPDLRKAHNGTLEYTSRDAHIGAFSRRGDLEILAYNLLEWTCGKLPWSADDTPTNVAKQKNAFMTQIKTNGSLRKIYPTFFDIPGLDILESFIRYVSKLEFDEEPNYKHCKDLLKKGLTKFNSLYLDEVAITTPPKAKASGNKLKRAATTSDVLDGHVTEEVIPKKIHVPSEEGPIKRPTRTKKKVNFNWAKVLSTDPEKMIRSYNGSSKESTPSPTKSPPIHNPTPAMLQILKKKKENMSTPLIASSASSSRSSGVDEPSSSLNTKVTTTRSTATRKKFDEKVSTLVNPTPAMLLVLQKKTISKKK